jgi:hypothetical protein
MGLWCNTSEGNGAKSRGNSGKAVSQSFSQFLLLTSAFEDEDDDEDKYEMPNAKPPGENARKRSWKRTAGPLARP